MRLLIAAALALTSAAAFAADYDWSIAGVYSDTTVDSCSGDCVGMLDNEELPVGLEARGYLGFQVVDVGAVASFSNGPGAYLSLRKIMAGLDLSIGAGKQFFNTKVGLPGALGTQDVHSDMYANAYFARVAFGHVFLKFINYDAVHSVSERDVISRDSNGMPTYGGVLAADYKIKRNEFWLGYTDSF